MHDQRVEIYNSRNQYASITTGNTRTAIGRAPVSWNILVNDVLATRTGELYHRSLTATNTTAPVWQSVVTKRDTNAPTSTGHLWHAQNPTVPTYDPDGNLTNDGRWLYAWNAENRLTQMESTPQATAAGHPYTKLQFVYNCEGKRIARHIWQGGTAAAPTFLSSTRYLYDAWNVIAEYTSSSLNTANFQLKTSLTWGTDLSGTLQGAGGVGGLLLITDHSAPITSYLPSYDGNGNITAWTASNGTSPISRKEYDAFGNTLVSEGVAPCSYGFSTKPQDDITGLLYYGYRWYDPRTGRWPSRDPIEERGGMNLYGFVNNDGVNNWDYLGLKPTKFDFQLQKVVWSFGGNATGFANGGNGGNGQTFRFSIYVKYCYCMPDTDKYKIKWNAKVSIKDDKGGTALVDKREIFVDENGNAGAKITPVENFDPIESENEVEKSNVVKTGTHSPAGGPTSAGYFPNTVLKNELINNAQTFKVRVEIAAEGKESIREFDAEYTGDTNVNKGGDGTENWETEPKCE
jgi:RHS repeat-associated protein